MTPKDSKHDAMSEPGQNPYLTEEARESLSDGSEDHPVFDHWLYPQGVWEKLFAWLILLQLVQWAREVIPHVL